MPAWSSLIDPQWQQQMLASLVLLNLSRPGTHYIPWKTKRVLASPSYSYAWRTFSLFFWTYFTGPKIEDLQILSINFTADENRHDMNLHRASLLYTHLVKRVNILFYNVYFKHFSKDSLEPLIRKRQWYCLSIIVLSDQTRPNRNTSGHAQIFPSSIKRVWIFPNPLLSTFKVAHSKGEENELPRFEPVQARLRK